MERLVQKGVKTWIIEGTIASGKSSFIEYLNTHWENRYKNIETLGEPLEQWRDIRGENILQLMYDNPKRWGFAFQSYAQLTMLKQHLKTTRNDNSYKVIERSLFSAKLCFTDLFYTLGYLSEIEHNILDEWYKHLINTEPLLTVDYIVYLKTDPKVALERLRNRARVEENLIDLDYLKLLNIQYEQVFLKSPFSKAPVFVLNGNLNQSEIELEYKRIINIMKNLI